MALHSFPPAWDDLRYDVGESVLALTQQVIDAIRGLSPDDWARLAEAPCTFPEIAIADAPTAVEAFAVTVTVQLTRVPGPALAAKPPIPYTPPPAPPLSIVPRRARPGRRPGRRRRP